MITKELIAYVTEIRRRLHQNPELSMEEWETTRLVCRELERFGLEVTRWEEIPGAVGLLRGGRPGPTVAFRADMDALPLQEDSGSPYASRRDGVMHACAHDGHTALLLGLARYFARRRGELAGNIKFIFQPGEEVPPGGAVEMIRRGVLEEPHVDAIFGLHHATENATGDIGVLPGPFLAGSATFTIRLWVKGGGGSAPHKGEDGIMAAVELLTAIQVEMTRRIDPVKPGLVSFGTIHAGTAPNILANQVEITGTARFFHPDVADRIQRLLRETAEAVAGRYQGQAEVVYEPNYPGVINHPAMTDLVKRAAERALGPGHVRQATPLMAGDDMAYFLQEVPGSYYWWGITPPSGMIAPAHTPRFDFDENAFEAALRVNVEIVVLALAELGAEGGRGAEDGAV